MEPRCGFLVQVQTVEPPLWRTKEAAWVWSGTVLGVLVGAALEQMDPEVILPSYIAAN